MSFSEATVRPLAESAIADASAMLGRAFRDDPLWNWVVPDEELRRASLGAFMAIGVRYGVVHGTVDAIGAGHEACAVWLRPGDSDFDPERGLAIGMGEAPRHLGDAGLGRFGAAMDHLGELHHRLMPGAHWYLMVLGVDPAYQRRGLGRAVLRPVLDAADRARQPCYLETQKAVNVPFYQAQGFAVRAETDLPDGGPHLWLMERVALAR